MRRRDKWMKRNVENSRRLDDNSNRACRFKRQATSSLSRCLIGLQITCNIIFTLSLVYVSLPVLQSQIIKAIISTRDHIFIGYTDILDQWNSNLSWTEEILRSRLISSFRANLDVSVIARTFIYIFLPRTKSKKLAGQRKGETLQLLWRLPPVAPWSWTFLELSRHVQVSTHRTHIALWLHNTVEWCLVEHFECWKAISTQDQTRSWQHAVNFFQKLIIMCRTRYQPTVTINYKGLDFDPELPIHVTGLVCIAEEHLLESIWW